MKNGVWGNPTKSENKGQQKEKLVSLMANDESDKKTREVKRIVVDISAAEHQAIKRFCVSNGLTIKQFVQGLIREKIA